MPCPALHLGTRLVPSLQATALKNLRLVFLETWYPSKSQVFMSPPPVSTSGPVANLDISLLLRSKDQDESPPPAVSVPPSQPVASATSSAKRSQPSHPAESPAKKQSKWSPEEDSLIIELRGSGMKWEDISKKLPGRSAISCRLHYQNYLERRSEWDEERKNKLARLYERLKPEMWARIAEEMAIPWRAAEAMHWQLGEQDMARRAGVIPFSLSNVAFESQPSCLPSPK
ncbi:MAG: hypothetical protein M1832_003885 [Thelocarpon impressellum]|nr:MAG: hypothetical protein M1832_003885 [Thelocarpon impressellum]